MRTFIVVAPAQRKGRRGNHDEAVKHLIDRLTKTARITVITGAGVSAASGVPTFRSAGGLWKNFKPETLATPQAFAKIPASCGSGTTGGGG